MPHPPKRQLPYEVFGFNTGAAPNDTIRCRVRDQLCPFVQKTCIKFRKSTPEVKIGSCILGVPVDGSVRPVIICPVRFNSRNVFRPIEREFFPNAQTVNWVSEVGLGKSGVVDYVATVSTGGKISDFLCLETQAGGTTGTPWPAVEYYRKHLTLEGAPKPRYGINWANQFAKTMLQQIYKKGTVISSWGSGRKLVVVLQDVGLDYLRKQGGGISEHCEDHPIQFRPFSLHLDENNDQWILGPSAKKYSADMEGIRLALTSSTIRITEEEFLASISDKDKQKEIFQSDIPI